jgi:hypothetical protein
MKERLGRGGEWGSACWEIAIGLFAAHRGAGAAGQGQAGAVVGVGDDLGCDGDGRFFGRVGAEIESDRGAQAGQLVLGYAGFAQRVQAVVVGAP